MHRAYDAFTRLDISEVLKHLDRVDECTDRPGAISLTTRAFALSFLDDDRAAGEAVFKARLALAKASRIWPRNKEYTEAFLAFIDPALKEMTEEEFEAFRSSLLKIDLRKVSSEYKHRFPLSCHPAWRNWNAADPDRA